MELGRRSNYRPAFPKIAASSRFAALVAGCRLSAGGSYPPWPVSDRQRQRRRLRRAGRGQTPRQKAPSAEPSRGRSACVTRLPRRNLDTESGPANTPTHNAVVLRTKACRPVSDMRQGHIKHSQMPSTQGSACCDNYCHVTSLRRKCAVPPGRS